MILLSAKQGNTIIYIFIGSSFSWSKTGMLPRGFFFYACQRWGRSKDCRAFRRTNFESVLLFSKVVHNSSAVKSLSKSQKKKKKKKKKKRTFYLNFNLYHHTILGHLFLQVASL